MAEKEVSIILRARNAMAAGIAGAKESIEKLGASAVNAGKIIATGFIAGAAALVAFATKALSAFAEQEKAEQALVAAMNAHGEAGQALLPTLKEVAARIQDQTGVADELTLATMAQGRMLGVGVGQLEEYAKGVVALKSAGMEGATAQRAMAAALQGNTEMLTRYLPELRGVTDEVEKQRIVNEFLARGYEQQKEQLNTVSGQWAALKGRLGDAWEEVGRGIASNGALAKAIEWTSEKVKAFTERISDWVGSGGVGRMTDAIKVFFLDMRQRWEMAGADAATFFGLIRDTTVFKYIAGVAVANFNLIKESIMFLVNVVAEAWNAIKTGGRDAFETPDTGPLKQAARDVVDAMKGNNIEVTTHYKDAVEARNQLEKTHASQVKELNEKITARQKAEFEKRQADAKAAADAAAGLAEMQGMREVESAKLTAKEIEAIRKEMLARQKDLQKELEGLEKEQEKAVKDAEAEKRKEREKTQAEIKRLANMTVADVLAAAEKEKAIAREVAKEDERMQELQNRVRRGARLSNRQAEQLDAWERIKAAKAAEAQIAEDAKVQAEHERNEKVRIENERKMRIEEVREDLAKLAQGMADKEIAGAVDLKEREEQITDDRVQAFIKGNQERREVEESNASSVIDAMEGVAEARDSLFPEAISGSVGDNVSGAISAAERFKSEQLAKLDDVIAAINDQTETLDELLRLG